MAGPREEAGVAVPDTYVCGDQYILSGLPDAFVGQVMDLGG